MSVTQNTRRQRWCRRRRRRRRRIVSMVPPRNIPISISMRLTAPVQDEGRNLKMPASPAALRICEIQISDDDDDDDDDDDNQRQTNELMWLAKFASHCAPRLDLLASFCPSKWPQLNKWMHSNTSCARVCVCMCVCVARSGECVHYYAVCSIWPSFCRLQFALFVEHKLALPSHSLSLSLSKFLPLSRMQIIALCACSGQHCNGARNRLLTSAISS